MGINIDISLLILDSLDGLHLSPWLNGRSSFLEFNFETMPRETGQVISVERNYLDVRFAADPFPRDFDKLKRKSTRNHLLWNTESVEPVKGFHDGNSKRYLHPIREQYRGENAGNRERGIFSANRLAILIARVSLYTYQVQAVDQTGVNVETMCESFDESFPRKIHRGWKEKKRERDREMAVAAARSLLIVHDCTAAS